MRPFDVAWTVLKQSGLQCDIRRSPNCTGKAEFKVDDIRDGIVDGYSCRNCLALDDGGFESTFDSVVEVDDMGQPVDRPFDVSQYLGDTV